MKNLLLSLFLLLSFVPSKAQDNSATTYEVYKSEFYTYSDKTKKWTLETQNNDVSILMVFYKDVINIQAKTPSLFKVKTETKTFFNGDGYRGYRFDALECVEGRMCIVDYVFLENDPKKYMLSITFEDKVVGKVNLRYYSTLNE